ncbi:MAG TPA: tRNA (adenosine(37)-N6)-threonylcarbamoyltransferase complex dimerization subunit type 1 TsaB, partial [Alphaproteobacteria bacterium]|nr:tRNA (adenosine(37)-N6)-threonylcarbamoyltransferase complex dimerization subunit type 1 TsaB [Alphaproteobacteria bacterium]
SRMVETARGQAAILVPTIQEVISEADCTFKDIELIACTIGPGSFTGLRIGLSTARTLALALDIPAVGLNTLDVMARHYQTEKPLLVVLETKRQDFYARYYAADGQPLTEPMAIDAQMILSQAPKGAFAVGGDCIERFKSAVSGDFELLDNLTQPDPILMAQMGREMFEASGDQGAPQPLYLRGADVSQPKTPPRKLEQA